MLTRGTTKVLLDGFEERVAMLRCMDSEVTPPQDAIFDRINPTTRVADGTTLTGVAVLISEVTDISGSDPVAHFSVATGGVADVRTVQPDLASTLVANTDPALAAIVKKCEPYSTGFMYGGCAQATKAGDVLYVFPVCTPDGMDFKIEYIPVVNLTRKQANDITKALAASGVNHRKCMNRVFRIGQTLLAVDRIEELWKVNISPSVC